MDETESTLEPEIGTQRRSNWPRATSGRASFHHRLTVARRRGVPDRLWAVVSGAAAEGAILRNQTFIATGVLIQEAAGGAAVRGRSRHPRRALCISLVILHIKYNGRRDSDK
jgi:hypothetical protein